MISFDMGEWCNVLGYSVESKPQVHSSLFYENKNENRLSYEETSLTPALPHDCCPLLGMCVIEWMSPTSSCSYCFLVFLSLFSFSCFLSYPGPTSGSENYPLNKTLTLINKQRWRKASFSDLIHTLFPIGVNQLAKQDKHWWSCMRMNGRNMSHAGLLVWKRSG